MLFDRDDIPDGRYEEHREPQGLIDAYVVELDPVVDGFSGVLVELYVLGTGVGHGQAANGASEVYEVRQSALASGNRLAVFSSGDAGLARAVFEGEIGDGGLSLPASCGSSCGSRI